MSSDVIRLTLVMKGYMQNLCRTIREEGDGPTAKMAKSISKYLKNSGGLTPKQIEWLCARAKYNGVQLMPGLEEAMARFRNMQK